MSAKHNLKKILIIRLTSIGDVVLCSHLPRLIKNKYNDDDSVQVHLLTSRHIAPLFTNNPHISKIIRYTSDTTNELNKEIIAENYDVVLDLQKNNSSAKLLAGYNGDIRQIEKYRKDKLKMVYLKQFPKDVVHVADRYLNTCRDLIVDDGIGLELFEWDKDRIVKKDSKQIIGIAPEAYHKTKRWPKDRFSKLIDILTSDGYHIRVFGKNESGLGRGNRNVTNYSGKLSLYDTAKKIKECDYFVSNDTGLMHIATAYLIPVLVIFGSSVKELGFTPYRATYELVEYDIWCRPCSHIGRGFCPLGHFKCMNNITVEEVYRKFNQLRNL